MAVTVASNVSVSSISSAVSANTDMAMNKSDDGLSVYNSVEDPKELIRQFAAQIDKTMMIQLLVPDAISTMEVKNVRAALTAQ